MGSGITFDSAGLGHGAHPAIGASSTATVWSPFGALRASVRVDRVGSPREVSLRAAKPGSDAATIVEALGRLASFAIQMPSTVSPAARLKAVIAELEGFAGARRGSPGMATSLPAAAAMALSGAMSDARDERAIDAVSTALPPVAWAPRASR